MQPALMPPSLAGMWRAEKLWKEEQKFGGEAAAA